MTSTADRDQLLGQISSLFGDPRAEHLGDQVFDLFTRPTYWPELLGARPCVLVGGRGTGKTTVLRGLSYEGQRRLSGSSDVSEWPFIGFYWRIRTNVVTAFRGAGLPEDDWIRLFSHYMNLVLIVEVVRFLNWYDSLTALGDTVLGSVTSRRLCRALHLPDASTLVGLTESLEDGIIDFEAFINNVAGEAKPPLSMYGRPIEMLVKRLRLHSDFAGKPFFFLFDEFENLEDYQQRVLNTLVKHSSDAITYKIGVRETGYRERTTLKRGEQLIEPADYSLIDIAARLTSTNFAEFARQICDDRLSHIRRSLTNLEVAPVNELLPDLPEAREAELLGIAARVHEARAQLRLSGADAHMLANYDSLSPLLAYLVLYWAEAQNTSPLASLDDMQRHPDQWSTRLGNYQHAMLFTIRRGRRGVRKYYAGWDTFVQLADGNIRFLLFLVTEALQRHVREGHGLAQPVTHEVQTEAAQDVGRRSLYELQGLAAEGGQLTRLVLGLGRIFGVMAAQPEGHAPEVNQFRVKWGGHESDEDREAGLLLSAAVMHLAVVRFPGDKPAGLSGETKNFDYQLHPIFAPFFAYSHRRKRRFSLTSDDLLALTREPSRRITAILRRSSRHADEELPEQLVLFEEFYREPA
jgi:hypothetical protein